jgi:hypothetical protein
VSIAIYFCYSPSNDITSVREFLQIKLFHNRCKRMEQLLFLVKRNQFFCETEIIVA